MGSEAVVTFSPYGTDPVTGDAHTPHPTQQRIREWVRAVREGTLTTHGIPTLNIQHGVNSGGTRGALAPILEYAFEQPGLSVLIGRRDFVDLRKSGMATFFSIVDPRLIAERDEQMHMYHLRTVGQGAAPSIVYFSDLKEADSLGSQEFAAILVIEAHQLTEDAFRKLRNRARQGLLPSFLILEGNPPSEGHWLACMTNPRDPSYDPSITVFELPSTENWDYMTPAYRQTLEAMPASWRRRYLLGKIGFLPSGTPVYPSFIESLHGRPTSLIPDRPLIRSWDFGYRRAACYDSDTELLTDRGWKRVSDATVGDAVMTLNPHTRAMEYQPVQATVSYPYTGAMYHWRDDGNAGYDARVTENHLMVVEGVRKRPYRRELRFLTAKQLADRLQERYKHRLWFLRTGRWAGGRIDAVRLPERISHVNGGVKVKEAVVWPLENYAEFMGLYLSEGSTTSAKAYTTDASKSHYTTTIWQKEADPVMAQVLEQTPFQFTRMQPHHHGWRTASAQLHEHLKPFGYSYEKYVPEAIKRAPTEIIQRFLTMYERGDGSHDGDWIKITTASARMADDLQELYLKCGYAARVSGAINSANRFSQRPIYSVSRLKTFAMRVQHSRLTVEQVVNEPVSCVTVPNHILYVRRNGRPMWCGNCLWSQRADEGRLLVHREWMALETPETEFIEGVKQRTLEWFGPRACVDYGDPAARNRDPEGVSTLVRLAQAGVQLVARDTTYAQRIPLINARFSMLIGGEPAIVVNPVCAILTEGLLGGYHYPEIVPDRKYTQKHEVPEHDQWFSHLCLRGDMRVRTLSGYVPIKDVRPGQWVWSWSAAERRMVPSQVGAVVDQGERETMRLLHDGGVLVATPEHPICLRDGTFVPLERLRAGDELMPFYEARKTRGIRDYPWVWLNDGQEPDLAEQVAPTPGGRHGLKRLPVGRGTEGFEHRIVYARLKGPLRQGFQVDHVDGVKDNNDPANLQLLSPSEHGLKTQSWKHTPTGKGCHGTMTPEVAAAARQRLNAVRRSGSDHWSRQPGAFTDELRKKFSEASLLTWDRKRANRLCLVCTETFWGTDRKQFCSKTCRLKAWKQNHPGYYSPAASAARTLARENHQVVGVEPDEVAHVYDLSIINGPQNFVCEGLVVHNCNSFEYLMVNLYLGTSTAFREERHEWVQHRRKQLARRSGVVSF